MQAPLGPEKGGGITNDPPTKGGGCCNPPIDQWIVVFMYSIIMAVPLMKLGFVCTHFDMDILMALDKKSTIKSLILRWDVRSRSYVILLCYACDCHKFTPL